MSRLDYEFAVTMSPRSLHRRRRRRRCVAATITLTRFTMADRDANPSRSPLDFRADPRANAERDFLANFVPIARGPARNFLPACRY